MPMIINRIVSHAIYLLRILEPIAHILSFRFAGAADVTNRRLGTRPHSLAGLAALYSQFNK